MSKDRGTIKWASLMLPEHVKLLQDMWRDDYRMSRPVLDSQETEMLNAQILEAFEYKSAISVSIYSDGTVINRLGIITKLDSQTNNVILQLTDSTQITIAFDDILSITIR
ncbi:YolD-like protein [Virgibacillus subterraneus]|uniref:YolD-like protein n=2 Tax=Virgibacillus TaxID=84406 RepID=A0A1H1BVF6_9BACI|nr:MULTISPECIES: YolD-like family protein [Virgibacillus]SDQ55905.1 YolD-like protein [Virgibacillus salinus]SEQ27950.1 YolD-like protein [Virgibacillus subterraneus]